MTTFAMIEDDDRYRRVRALRQAAIARCVKPRSARLESARPVDLQRLAPSGWDVTATETPDTGDTVYWADAIYGLARLTISHENWVELLYMIHRIHRALTNDTEP